MATTKDYTIPQSRAAALLAKAGESMQVVKFTKTHDPVAGTNTTVFNATGTISGVELPASEGIRQKFQSTHTEELNRSTTRFFIISAKGLSYEVESDGLIFIGDTYYEIRGATPLKPNTTTTILYWIMVMPKTKSFSALDALVWTSIEELNTELVAILQP